jgi:hypothetical protein
MDWNRMRGTGSNSRAEPKRSGAGSRTTISMSLMGGKSSSKASFRNATALPRIRPRGMSRLGSGRCHKIPCAFTSVGVMQLKLLANINEGRRDVLVNSPHSNLHRT